MRVTKKRINELNLLRLLRKLKSEDVRLVLQYLNENGLNILGELTKNLLYCRCNITPKEKITLKKKLSPHKRAFQKIARKKTNQEQRRRLLIDQNGSGLLSLLLSIGVPLLTSILFKN